ncbi:MAG: tRNA glutamyl-Q(34) synthetase GluQRS [Acidovorax sp.]
MKRPQTRSYIGRFAPSPTGPLHAGSLVAALGSWLDARAHSGRWLVRIEDVDAPRCPPGADATILRQLAACGLHADEPPLWQSTRGAAYAGALAQLQASGWAYPCACTRKEIEAAWAAQGLAHERHVERPYPGTCRAGLRGRPARAWRFNTTEFEPNRPPAQTGQALAAPVSIVHWTDRRLGPQQQGVARTVGDFILRRADGLWAYQLAVVADDAEQGITHVVRGEDLADNTPRQILLQRALGLPTPRYLHMPLVRTADGEKLSKQHGAPALDVGDPLRALNAAAGALGLPRQEGSANDALAAWVQAWAHLYPESTT